MGVEYHFPNHRVAGDHEPNYMGWTIVSSKEVNLYYFWLILIRRFNFIYWFFLLPLCWAGAICIKVLLHHNYLLLCVYLTFHYYLAKKKKKSIIFWLFTILICQLNGLSRPELFSVLAQQLQSADVLTSHRIFMIIFRSLKELSTKRLISDQRNFAEVWVDVIFYSADSFSLFHEHKIPHTPFPPKKAIKN